MTELLTNPVPPTVMVNAPTPRLEGLTELTTGMGLTSVTVAEANFVGSAALVAVMVMLLGFGTLAGAR